MQPITRAIAVVLFIVATLAGLGARAEPVKIRIGRAVAAGDAPDRAA